MDFVSTTLVTLTQPTGFWPSILNAFKGATGTYILAVILIAVIVRVLFSVVDVINKKVTMKNNVVMAKMKPELDALQKKYGHDTKLLSQKQNELYRKYQFNMMGACFPMLIAMILQTVVFLTLWNSLSAVSNYNVVDKYETMKYVYANVVNLNTKDLTTTIGYESGDELSVEINLKENKVIVTNKSKEDQVTDFEFKKDWSNEEIYNNLIDVYVNKGTEEQPNGNYINTTNNEVFKKLAEETSEKYYLDSQEGFLWIKNIYRAESPSSSLFTKSEVTKYMSSFYSDEEKELEKTNQYEEKIFDYVVTNGIGQKDLGHNGYYILTILAVVVSFLSMWLSNKLMRNKNAPVQQSGKMMYFIMPLIMGIFTFMYTSLFAIYIIVGQLMMMLITPLTTMIVRKWNNHDIKKQQEKNTAVVDYRRKDI